MKTENSYLRAKVELRKRFLPNRPGVRVLDLFSADGTIWNTITRETRRKIDVLRIEKEPDRQGTYLRGDNLKFLGSLDLDRFDVIDLDAYGVPFKQLERLFEKRPAGAVVHVTFIQSMYGGLPRKMLLYLGYTEAMVKKIPSLFFRDGFEKFKAYLYAKGIRKIWHVSVAKKHYLTFYFPKGTT